MKVFAHRGASGDFAENTLTAIKQAIVQQADGIEIDAQYHKSGRWWLLHDLYVDKTTQGNGRLLALDEASIQALRTRDGEPLPELYEALNAINGQCGLNIEIKISTAESHQLTEAAQSLVELINQTIKQSAFEWHQITISSFNHLFLQTLKATCPKANIGALIAHCPATLAEFGTALGASSVNLSLDCLSKSIVDDAHHRGLEAWVYTVDRPEDIEFCHRLGVDCVFSNHPKKTKDHIKSIS
ncbi:MAG: glycerophosphodiester phosphodiesterase [Colwelliaceae bacterium]|nr:glycerophosphodiester phosphodiesterase [Colwelliaceae bacterium]